MYFSGENEFTKKFMPSPVILAVFLLLDSFDSKQRSRLMSQALTKMGYELRGTQLFRIPLIWLQPHG